jgi:beta-lactam-binding protein with PASTA domain
MSFLGFLANKRFYIHLGISIVLTVVLLLVAIMLMKGYTRHGKAFVVPDLTGKEYDRLFDVKEAEVFQFLVTDSVFDNSLAPGSIIKQNPSAGSKAKEGRTIYLTVVSKSPKMSLMPELKDLTVRQAVTTLKTNGLRIRRIIFTPYFAGNSVLGQYYNGDTLWAGTEILEGSEIDILAGLGENRAGRVPYVLGLTRDEARAVAQMASFNVGAEHYLEQANSLHSRVYRQYPGWNDEMRPGDSLTLYFRSDQHFDFNEFLRTNNPDTAVFEGLPEGAVIDSTELEEE